MEILSFESKQAFDDYLINHVDRDGFWVRFYKGPGPKLTWEDSVEVALKYGFIDGHLKSIDEYTYQRYFTKRRPKSVWSTKNKNTVNWLIETNQMHDAGLKAVLIAKENGCWDKGDTPPDDFSLDDFKMRLSNYKNAYENYLKMSPSVQKTYALSYYALKTDAARLRRLDVIKNRLEQNLKPI